MRLERVAKLAQTLLYEGYLLYPYRTSAVKNSHRWVFGSLYPQAFAVEQDEADPWWMQTECLVRGAEDTELEARVHFLHFTESAAVERHVDAPARPLGQLRDTGATIPFEFGTPAEACALRGAIDVAVERAGDGVFKLTLRVCNVTPFAMEPSDSRTGRRDAALRVAFASTHAILGVCGGEFISLVDPPEPLRDAAARCANVGTWPVLVGSPDARDMMLAAPIILDDYPQVAPESQGDFFDATEIDELLTLRVLTLTEAEKDAIRRGDARGQALLERTEALVEDQRRRLHGASRAWRAGEPSVECSPRAPGPQPRSALRLARHAWLCPGIQVRLVPREGGDIFDLALAGRTATVVKIEEDYEGRLFVAVTVDDDPGRDLGVEGRPGHRFFFRPEEVEPLP